MSFEKEPRISQTTDAHREMMWRTIAAVKEQEEDEIERYRNMSMADRSREIIEVLALAEAIWKSKESNEQTEDEGIGCNITDIYRYTHGKAS